MLLVNLLNPFVMLTSRSLSATNRLQKIFTAWFPSVSIRTSTRTVSGGKHRFSSRKKSESSRTSFALPRHWPRHHPAVDWAAERRPGTGWQQLPRACHRPSGDDSRLSGLMSRCIQRSFLSRQATRKGVMCLSCKNYAFLKEMKRTSEHFSPSFLKKNKC